MEETRRGLINELFFSRRDSLLRKFLQASSLSSEGDNQTEEESKDVGSLRLSRRPSINYTVESYSFNMSCS